MVAQTAAYGRSQPGMMVLPAVSDLAVVSSSGPSYAVARQANAHVEGDWVTSSSSTRVDISVSASRRYVHRGSAAAYPTPTLEVGHT